VVYNILNFCALSFGILETRSVSVLRRERGDTLLGPFERDNIDYLSTCVRLCQWAITRKMGDLYTIDATFYCISFYTFYCLHDMFRLIPSHPQVLSKHVV
jgi:hypothetical protein